MRTTLELDRDLLERAKSALGATSFTETIETALRHAVARAESRTAWDALIGLDLSWESVDDLIEYRRRHGTRKLR